MFCVAAGKPPLRGDADPLHLEANRAKRTRLSRGVWEIALSLSKKERERILREHCGVINEDDAVDPRHNFYNKRRGKDQFRKAFQLARQVSETLQMVLTGGDPMLDGLAIVDVVPAPDARRMLVIVGVDSGAIESATHLEEIHERLGQHVPRLRGEIARSINRRKTPQLVFELTTSNR